MSQPGTRATVAATRARAARCFLERTGLGPAFLSTLDSNYAKANASGSNLGAHPLIGVGLVIYRQGPLFSGSATRRLTFRFPSARRGRLVSAGCYAVLGFLVAPSRWTTWWFHTIVLPPHNSINVVAGILRSTRCVRLCDPILMHTSVARSHGWKNVHGACAACIRCFL